MISLKKNTYYSILLTLTNIVFPLISFAYVSRILGPSTLGSVNFASALVSYFVLVASVGIPLYGAREIARVRSDVSALNKTCSELLVINVVSSIITAVLYAGLFLFSKRVQSDGPLFALLGLNIIANAISIDWIYQGLENYRFITLRSCAIKSISLVLVFLSIHEESDYLRYSAIIVGSVVLYNLVAILNSRRYIAFGLRNLDFGRHVRPLAMLFASAMTASVYVYLDSVLLGILSGTRAVGLYTVAMKIDKIVVALVSSLGAVVVPRAAFYLEHAMDSEYRSLTQKSIHFTYLIAFPSAVFIASMAPQIVGVVAGPKFGEAVQALRIGALIIPIIGFTNFLGIQVLVPNRQEKGLFVATFAASVANVVLNFLLIPKYAQNGAAVANVGAELIALIAIVAWAWNGLIKFRLFDHRALRYLLMSLAIAPILLLVGGLSPNIYGALVAGTVCGGLLYFGGLFLLGDGLVVEMAQGAMQAVYRACGSSKRTP